MDEMEKSGMTRRDFIKSAALVGAMLGVSPVIGGCAAKSAGGNTPSGKNTGESGGPPRRTLGKGNAALEVSALGFGCMGLNYHRSRHPDKKMAIRLVRRLTAA